MDREGRAERNVFVDARGCCDAVENGNPVARQPSGQRAEQAEPVDARYAGFHFQQDFAVPVFIEVHAAARRKAGQRRGHGGRALAVGAGAEHGIHKGRGRGFAPRDMLAEGRQDSLDERVARTARQRAHFFAGFQHADLIALLRCHVRLGAVDGDGID